MNKRVFLSILVLALVSCSVQPTSRQQIAPTSSQIYAISPENGMGLPSDVVWRTIPSPNGDWVANQVVNDSLNEIQKIEIRNKQNKIVWEIPYQAKRLDSISFASYISIYRWSKDSSALYFYYTSHQDPTHSKKWMSHDLKKIDLKTGEILPILTEVGFVEFSISPNELQLAYALENEKFSLLHIRNLDTRFEITTDISFASGEIFRVYEITWSPSGNKLAFQSETVDGIVQTIYLDPLTLEQKVIKRYLAYNVKWHGWKDDMSFEFTEGENTLYINIENNEFILVGTTTPTP